jgi:flagellar biosynthesis chaperone FliJ
MARFRFRLERLARVRALEERVARAAWGAAERGARQAEAAADTARAALAGGREELRARLAREPLDPQGVLIGQSALVRLGRALARRREDWLTRRGQAERLAEAWRERRGRSEALELLRQREREAHAREALRREAAASDERALARFRRSGPGEGPGESPVERLPAPDPGRAEPI